MLGHSPPSITRHQDILDIEKQDLHQRFTHFTVYEALMASARAYGDRPAIVFADDEDPFHIRQTYTYEEFGAALHRAMNFLAALGCRGDEPVAVLLPLVPEAQILLWAAECQGIALPINPFLEAEHIRSLIAATGARVVVASGPDWQDGTWEKIAALRRDLPSVRHVVSLGKAPDALCYEEEVQRYPADGRSRPRDLSPGSIAAYFHTGGSTGAPKLAVHTHEGQMAKVWTSHLSVGPGERVLLGLPLFHVMGALLISLRSFSHGETVVMMTSQGYRHPDVVPNLWKLIDAYAITDVFAVPTIYAALLEQDVGDADLSRLRRLFTGATTVPTEQCHRIHALTGLKLIEGYGMTELYGLASVNPPGGEVRYGSAGLRVPYQDMKVVELDENGRYRRTCDVDEIGAIVVSGAGVIERYVDDRHTEKLFARDMPYEGRWLISGDLGRLDADGYVWITGRAKDLIIRGGHNIDPVIIEDALYAHDAVEVAAAVGQPDARSGELPVAYVTLKPGADVSEEALLDWARRHVPERAACPVHVFILERMPVTAVGKIYKPALVAAAVERVYGEVVAEIMHAAHGWTVEAVTDDKQGLMAVVRLTPASGGGPTGQRLKDAARNIREALAAYPVPARVEIAAPAGKGQA